MVKELRLALLGGLQITRGETPLMGFVSSKAQALLCYLAVTGRPHSRAELAPYPHTHLIGTVAELPALWGL